MSPARRAAVVAGVLLLIAGAALLAWRVLDDDPSTPTGLVAGVTDARRPFTGLTAGTAQVGGQTVRVVVADSTGERIQGLRGRSGPAPYDAMLFAFPGDTTTAFTMAGVPDPLDIAFFDRRGARVDALRMEPCVGTDASCPTYQSSAPFRYALETASGDMPAGRLRVG